MTVTGSSSSLLVVFFSTCPDVLAMRLELSADWRSVKYKGTAACEISLCDRRAVLNGKSKRIEVIRLWCLDILNLEDGLACCALSRNLCFHIPPSKSFCPGGASTSKLGAREFTLVCKVSIVFNHSISRHFAFEMGMLYGMT